MGRTRGGPSEARQRLLRTADQLFYTEGVQNVGIDKVIAVAAVAKMTLYAHFPSKDDLIVAVLRYREEQVLAFFDTAIARHRPRCKSALRAFFAALKEWFTTPGFRGCAFQNAAVELADPTHPGTQFVREHKQRFTAFLRGFVEEAVGHTAPKLAAMVALLVEGAVVTAVITGTPDPADVAREAALKLVEEA